MPELLAWELPSEKGSKTGVTEKDVRTAKKIGETLSDLPIWLNPDYDQLIDRKEGKVEVTVDALDLATIIQLASIGTAMGGGLGALRGGLVIARIVLKVQEEMQPALQKLLAIAKREGIAVGGPKDDED